MDNANLPILPLTTENSFIAGVAMAGGCSVILDGDLWRTFDTKIAIGRASPADQAKYVHVMKSGKGGEPLVPVNVLPSKYVDVMKSGKDGEPPVSVNVLPSDFISIGSGKLTMKMKL